MLKNGCQNGSDFLRGCFLAVFLQRQITQRGSNKQNNKLCKMEKITFVLIDESVLTNGMRVLVSGIDTAQFEKNPVMFYFHDSETLPIGVWSNVRKENGQLLADAEFDEEDPDKDVQRIIHKIKKGYIKMASAGLVDLELSDEDAYKVAGQTGYTAIKSRIREASIVPIGRNHNALAFRLFDNDGNELTPGKPESELKLADFLVSPKITTNMSKKYLKTLNLSDDASDDMIEAAVEKLHGDKEAAEARATQAQEKLEALELADRTEKRNAFGTEVDEAITSGRVNEKEDGSVKASFLNLFDKDPEAARTALGALPNPTKLKELNLGDKNSDEYKAFEQMTFDELDKSGKALNCFDKYPDLYREKYKAKFGKESTK